MQAAGRLSASLLTSSRVSQSLGSACLLPDALGVLSPYNCCCALISLSRFSVSAPRLASELEEKLTVVQLPQLSPHMASGKVRKWLKKPGDAIATYDVVMEVDTDNLSEEAYKVGDFAGTVTMLVEVRTWAKLCSTCLFIAHTHLAHCQAF